MGFGDPKAYTSRGEPCLGPFDLAVDAFFDTLRDCGLHLIGCGFGVLQTSQALFPLRQLGIAQGRILNDLVALVFSFQGSDCGISLRGAHEIVQCRIEQGGLRIDIEQRRRGTLKRRGNP